MATEQLNEPEWPTQLQIDWAFIRKLVFTVNNCQYDLNRNNPNAARLLIEDLKQSDEWREHPLSRLGPPTGVNHGE